MMSAANGNAENYKGVLDGTLGFGQKPAVIATCFWLVAFAVIFRGLLVFFFFLGLLKQIQVGFLVFFGVFFCLGLGGWYLFSFLPTHHPSWIATATRQRGHRGNWALALTCKGSSYSHAPVITCVQCKY